MESIIANMVTRIRKGVRGHLYISEWFAHLSLSDQNVADRMETSPTTVWRWKKEQHRLDPGKIAALANAIGIEPEQFWRLPPPKDGVDRPSVDALLKDASEEQQLMALDIVKRLVAAGGGK